MKNFGTNGNLLTLLSNYLKGRWQYVALNNTKSNLVKVTFGVPQDSNLGPIMFSIFVNDVAGCFKFADFSLYADDFKIFKQIKDNADYVHFQMDLNNFSNYCKANQLQLNISKCFHILFQRKLNPLTSDLYIDNNKIKTVDEVRDLGVTLDYKLNFENHVNNIVQSAFRRLGFVLRVTKDFTGLQSVITLYVAYVRSILEYSSVIWNPLYHKYIDKIERVQKKFINCLTYRYCRHRLSYCYELNVIHYNLMTLRSRRILFDVCFIFKVLNNLIDSHYCLENIYLNCSPHQPRKRRIFYINAYNTNYMLNSPLIRCTSTCNSIISGSDFDIFSVNYIYFKKQVKNSLEP